MACTNASAKFAAGDTVAIAATVVYASKVSSHVTVELTNGDVADVEAGVVTLTAKKAVPTHPAKGSVISAVSRYGTKSKYLVDYKGELTLLDVDGHTYTSYTTWEWLHTEGYAVTVL